MGRVASVSLAPVVGAGGAPSASVALPASSAISSFSMVFCRSRVAMEAWMSSKPRAALIASKVAVSSSPRVA